MIDQDETISAQEIAKIVRLNKPPLPARKDHLWRLLHRMEGMPGTKIEDPPQICLQVDIKINEI